MFWPLMLSIVFLLVFLVYVISKILLQNRIVVLLKSVLDDSEGTSKKKRMIYLNRINLISFLVLAAILCLGLIRAVMDSYDLDKGLALSKQAQEKIELDDALFTKPSRGMYSSAPSLWVILKYPQKGMESYGKLSEGPGEVTGRILLNKKPLAGKTVSLILNDGEKGLDCLKTDVHGYYKASIPYGKYEFNAVIITGDELGGRISPQNSVNHQEPSDNGEAQVFELNERNRSFQIVTIELVDPIKHITPANSIVSLTKAVKGTKIFEWRSIPEAQKYGVEVSRVVKEMHDKGEGKSYYPDEKSLPFRTRDTFITLEQFERLVTVYEPGVYGIRIFAYGNDDRILSYSLTFQEIALAVGEVEALVSKK
jgi:hypothetical protein